MTAYQWREDDPQFKADWERCRAAGLDALEDEATRRAFEGVAEPVFHLGVPVGTVQKYSDTLTIFLLKGGKPEKYKDRVEHSGSVDIAARIVNARKRAGG